MNHSRSMQVCDNIQKLCEESLDILRISEIFLSGFRFKEVTQRNTVNKIHHDIDFIDILMHIPINRKRVMLQLLTELILFPIRIHMCRVGAILCFKSFYSDSQSLPAHLIDNA